MSFTSPPHPTTVVKLVNPGHFLCSAQWWDTCCTNSRRSIRDHDHRPFPWSLPLIHSRVMANSAFVFRWSDKLVREKGGQPKLLAAGCPGLESIDGSHHKMVGVLHFHSLCLRNFKKLITVLKKPQQPCSQTNGGPWKLRLRLELPNGQSKSSQAYTAAEQVSSNMLK